MPENVKSCILSVGVRKSEKVYVLYTLENVGNCEWPL